MRENHSGEPNSRPTPSRSIGAAKRRARASKPPATARSGRQNKPPFCSNPPARRAIPLTPARRALPTFASTKRLDRHQSQPKAALANCKTPPIHPTQRKGPIKTRGLAAACGEATASPWAVTRPRKGYVLLLLAQRLCFVAVWRGVVQKAPGACNSSMVIA